MMMVHARFELGSDLLETVMSQPKPETPTTTATTTTGTTGGSTDDQERRIRRKISNRESARRSRMRKRKYVEELEGKMDRLASENRELVNRIYGVNQCCLLLHRDSDRLRREEAHLSRRLSDARRILAVRQLAGLTGACGGLNVNGFLTGSELLLT